MSVKLEICFSFENWFNIIIRIITDSHITFDILESREIFDKNSFKNVYMNRFISKFDKEYSSLEYEYIL